MQIDIPSEGGLSLRAKRSAALLKLLSAAIIAAGVSTTFAASVTYNFDTDPAGVLTVNGNNDQPWQAAGGNPATGGFLALTYPQGSQEAAIVFPDADNGQLVKAFRFEADLRVGNSQGDRPADGFSVSFARGNDPYLADPTNMRAFAVNGPPEFGTATGIVVSFDTWAGNNELPGGDIEGIIVRVDNVTINKTELLTRNGACDDNTTLQTGLRDAAFWTDEFPADPDSVRRAESWDTLCWQPFFIDLDDTGKLTVSWKGRLILDKFQTTYFPSVGQLVLGGRTGGANEHTHFDNIKLTTVLANEPIIGSPIGDSCGFTVPFADAQGASPVASSIAITVNGATVPVTTRREAPNTFADVVLATRLAPGSTNTVVITAQTSTGATLSQTRQWIVPAATVIPASAKASAFTASSSGFLVRTHMMDSTRGPGDQNTIENAETQLGGRFTDAAGVVNPNTADMTGAVNGFLTAPLINFDQNAADIDANNPDNFNTVEPVANPRPNEAIPGVAPADASNIAMEVLTFLDLPAGCHTLGVNSDDGFLVTLGHSQFGTVLGSFNGGRGAGDSLFRIVVEEAGVYPIRLSWWEAGGGANVEFFSVVGTNKILINDRDVTGHIKAYSAGTTVGSLQDFGIQRANFGPNPGSAIQATFRDGSTTVDDASIRLLVDGQQVTAAPQNSGQTTTVSFSPAGGFALGSTHSARLIYTIAGVTRTNDISFTVRLGGFFIEAEHYNNAGANVPAVNTMPYIGDEYLGMTAVHDTDYHQTYDEQDPGSLGYREGDSPNVPMDRQVDAGTTDIQRGDFVLTENYKIGWANEGDWYNYTRTFTNGNYLAYGAQSMGEGLNLPDRQRLRLTVLGAGGAQQVIGSYSEPASGTWGVNTIYPLMNGPVPAVVSLSGTQTIRAYQEEGDFDWFVFVPTTNAVSTPNFVIEAEDFNHGGGQTIAAASTMPLTTAPYNTLAATTEVDYHVIGDVTDAGSDFYRTNELPHVPINENNARSQGDRGLFIRTNNYKIGWIDAGEWFNYTRTFPDGNYNVYAAISHGGGATDRTSGSLQLVTAGATTTTQTTQDLGTFDAPGATGGWGNNRLVPLMSGGGLASVALSGTQTVRYTAGSGDFDYLVFVKSAGGVTPTGPRITAVTRSGNNITITWTGGGTLEGSATLGPTAAWAAVTGAGAGTATVPADGRMRFFRVRVP